MTNRLLDHAPTLLPPSSQGSGLDVLPLSRGQLSFWLAHVLDRTDPSLNLSECVEIDGAVDPVLFERALRYVVSNSDALNIRIVERDTGPVQVLEPDPRWTFDKIDFTREENPEAAVRAWMAEATNRPFSLTSGQPFRFALLRISADRYFWFGVIHHIVSDAAGARLLVERVAAAYTRLAEGRSLRQDDTGSVVEVLAEEQDYLISDHCRRDREFWQQHLANLPPRASLSAKHAQRSSGFAKSIGWLPRQHDLQITAGRFGSNAAAMFAAAAAVYLHRMTGCTDVVLGMPVTARIGSRMRSIIGPVVNAVPVRLSLSARSSIQDVVTAATREFRLVLRHQRYRNEDIRRDLGLGPRDPDVASTYVNYIPLDETIRFAGAKVRRDQLTNWRVDDLQFVFFGGSDPRGLRIDTVANAALYSEEEVERHGIGFVELLSALSSLPADTAIGEIAIGDLCSVAAKSLAASANMSKAGPVSNDSDVRTAAEPPCTPTELKLAKIWKDVLRCGSVTRDDDFFENGGDSLLANLLMTRARKAFSIQLPLKTVFEASTLRSLSARIDRAAAEAGAAPLQPVIERGSVGSAPLSFSQHRMWLIQSLDASNTAYNMSAGMRLTGVLDAAALSRAVTELVKRHDILRTIYFVADGQVQQQVLPETSAVLDVVDLTHEDGDAELCVARLANETARHTFDLTKGPVFICRLMRLSPADHLLQFTAHHIAGDQWSFGVLARELSALYNAARSGKPADLVSAPIQYRDFARWQSGRLKGPELASQLQYWKQHLANLPTLNLQTDRQRPRIQSLNGSIVKASVKPALFDDLEKLGRTHSATLFMTMLAGFAALLHRLGGQSDIPIGVPIANRTHNAVENVVGTFVNTLVLRTDLGGDPTFGELLERVRSRALDAFANQDVPFDFLVQEIVQTRDTSRSPLVQVMFNMLNAPMHAIDFDGLSWTPHVADRGGAQFELSLTVDRQIGQSLMVEFNTDLFERATIERFTARYLHLLEAVARSPGARLSEINLMPEDERRLLLGDWNATEASRDDKLFIAAFEEVAASRSHSIAAEFENDQLTYAELDIRASLLAHELIARGAGRGSVVGVCLERSLEMLVALLAVQKSGAAYVPLDPRLPAARLQYMVEDSGLGIVISAGTAAQTLALPSGVVVLDAAAKLPGTTVPHSRIEAGPKPEDPAYIIYTSGSTGKPKGVAVSHGALANFLYSMAKEPGLSAQDVLAAVTTISFDIAALELYLPLLVGARIELVASATAADGEALTDLLQRRGATVMQATPATWRMLLEAGWQGGPHFRSLCGGEAMTRELADLLVDRTSEVWNLYGPTETTVWSTACRVAKGDGPISVGKPIDNTRIYILNGRALAPIGIAGEICIGGSGVAIGYHARPELTAERFQDDLFVPGTRIYRTGDLGRWGSDGLLYHMGRMDYQVKVRGFRIELGEIEAVLDAHEAVRKSVVVAKELSASDTRLVGYVVHDADPAPTASELRRYLRQHLPDYMVPSLILTLDRIPLTPNGKIDRNALPDPFAGISEERDSHAEGTKPGAETVLAEIWREALKVDRIGPDDNFFDRGGHSLLAIRVVTQIEQQLGVRLDPRVLFFQSLRQIASGLSTPAERER